MTQKEKRLLLKDLCARIPYRPYVLLNPGAYNKPERCILCGVDGEDVYLNVDSDPFSLGDVDIKPYLRHMSSMTEEEEIYYNTVYTTLKFYEKEDWLLEHHFDYRMDPVTGKGMIDMGLAEEAPEGMYD